MLKNWHLAERLGEDEASHPGLPSLTAGILVCGFQATVLKQAVDPENEQACEENTTKTSNP